MREGYMRYTVLVRPTSNVFEIATLVRKSFEAYPKADDPRFLANLSMLLAFSLHPSLQAGVNLRRTESGKFLRTLMNAVPEPYRRHSFVWKSLAHTVHTRYLESISGELPGGPVI